MAKFLSCRRRLRDVLALMAAVWFMGGASRTVNAGEPAAEFLKRLRAAKYFDTAIYYLDRLNQYPNVDPELIDAIALEKAQTFIDAAGASRSADARDEFLQQAEEQLGEFLKRSAHPRLSEARLQLGRLQMVRALQLMSGEVTDAKRQSARESFVAASKTFQSIEDELRATLKEMQGARIDAAKEPEKVALRDQYRGEFLQAMSSAGDALFQAAKTFKDPGAEGKPLLEQALAKFNSLSEDYDAYVQGAIAMLQRAEAQYELGMLPEAMDSYLRMLEQPDADALRLAKFQATTGIIRLMMAETPPRFQAAIDRGQPMLDVARPNERNDPIVQELRLELAQAYLAKSKDEDNQKSADLKRAESEGRQLLIQASKIPGDLADKANQLLSEMGIDLNKTVEIPTTEEPSSFDDGLERAREMLLVLDQLAGSLQVLEQEENPSDEIRSQIESNRQQLQESRSIAIQLLRRGLARVTLESDNELVNQARQFLAYLLYEQQQYHEATVVGTFLMQNAPGSELGLRGGLLAMNSLQLMLVDNPDNTAAINRLEQLISHLTKNWPDDPEAASAQGVLVKLALRADRWDEAQQLIETMSAGTERAALQRLLGQLLWNKSIQTRQDGDDASADQFLVDAAKALTRGLDEIPGNLVDPEAMKAALVLAKVHLKQGNIQEASNTLENETYGPVVLIDRQGAPDDSFARDLYSTQLQVLVQRMTTETGDAKPLLDRASEVMEKLRESTKGPDAQRELTRIYILMARDIREQLQDASPAQKAKLVEAFRVFLDRIATTTDDAATLQWVGQTLMDLAEASMPPGTTQATGLAAGLLSTATETFQRLGEQPSENSNAIQYQLGRAYRMLGQFKESLDVLTKLLREKPTMLDAQFEAALAYEQWASTAPPSVVARVYEAALSGARADANGKNVIWGWGKISQETSRNPKYQDRFFDSRYHVALCRFLAGKAEADPNKKKLMIEKSITDITRVAALYPELGGPEQRAKFDALLRLVQKELRQPEVGLPPLAGTNP